MKLKRKSLTIQSLNYVKKLTPLRKWLSSKTDFNEAIKLIEDDNTNNVKSSSGDKKVFNELINNIKNKKATRIITIKKIRDIFSDLDQQNQKMFCFSK